MINDDKWLSVQSFQRNQSLLEALNTYLIYLKLSSEGLEGNFEKDEIEKARLKIIGFLKMLNEVTNEFQNSKASQNLFGLDERFRSLVKDYIEARKRTKFRSILFRKSPSQLISLLNQQSTHSQEEVIKSLTELETLLEDHSSFDLKEVLGNF